MADIESGLKSADEVLLSNGDSQATTSQPSLLSLPFTPDFSFLTNKADADIESARAPAISVLDFTDVNYERKGTKVLIGVDGRTRPGEMLSIMGPSHAGKTKLLNVLAGTVQSSKGQTLSGIFVANDRDQYFSVLRAGFVAKNENMFQVATVREEIMLSAALRLPGTVSRASRETLVDSIVRGLGFESTSSLLVKRLSKLQKKLLAIGVELAALPNVLFLDEPTSGLDPTSAWQLVTVLNRLAATRTCLVIASLQQPSSEVFNNLTHVMTLSQGRVIFDGQAKDVATWLATKGYSCPGNFNPGDILLSCARTLPLEAFFPAPVISNGNGAPKQLNPQKKQSVHPLITHQEVTQFLQRPRHRSSFVEFGHIFFRDLRATKRDPRLLLGRFIMSALIFVLCACVFLGAGDVTSPKYFIGSHFASFVFTMFTSCFGVMVPTVMFLIESRGVYVRERALNMYGTIPYVISKVIIEMVVNFLVAILCVLIMYWSAQWKGSFIMIVLAYFLLLLSCLSWAYFLALSIPSPGAAVGLVALVLVPQLLFMGTFVRIGSLPVWLQWVSYICNITYALRFVTVVEFDAANCHGPDLVCFQWKAVVEGNNIIPSQLWLYGFILALFFVVLRALAFVIIRQKIIHANRFGEL